MGYRIAVSAVILLVALLISGCTAWGIIIAPGSLVVVENPTIVGIPTITANPTAIPTIAPTPTQEFWCWGTVVDGPLRVRSSPWLDPTNANVVRSVQKGDLIALEGKFQDTNSDWWYKIYDGYVWASLVAPQATTACNQLPDITPPRTAWGPLVVDGTNLDEVLAYGEIIKAAGRQPAVTVVLAPAHAYTLHAAGWYVIFRPIAGSVGMGDCPNNALDPITAANIWYNYVVSRTPVDATDVMQVSNECSFPSPAYYKALALQIITRANADGIAVIPHVFSTGTPDFVGDPAWIPALKAVAAALRTNGGCSGWNLYAIEPGVSIADHVPSNDWTIGRVRMMGIPGPHCVTELGRDDIRLTPDEVAAYTSEWDGFYRAVTFWYYGPPSGWHWAWANLAGYLEGIGRAVVAGMQKAPAR